MGASSPAAGHLQRQLTTPLLGPSEPSDALPIGLLWCARLAVGDRRRFGPAAESAQRWRFKEIVEGDKEIAFSAIPNGSLWDEWNALSVPDLEPHLAALRSRYAVELG